MQHKLARWTPELLDQWQRFGKRNLLYYILAGTFFWGGAMSVVMSLFWHGFFAMAEPPLRIVLPFVLLITVGSSLFLGALGGAIFWYLVDRSYRKAQQTRAGSTHSNSSSGEPGSASIS
jgi:hypothetical protein